MRSFEGAVLADTNKIACHKIQIPTDAVKSVTIPGCKVVDKSEVNFSPNSEKCSKRSHVMQLSFLSPSGVFFLLAILLTFISNAYAKSYYDFDNFIVFDPIKHIWYEAKTAEQMQNIGVAEYDAFSNFWEKRDKREIPSFRGQYTFKWNNPEALEIINAEPNAELIKLGYGYHLILLHWNYRFNHRYLPVIERHGFKFNQITDAELCEQLRDPLFGTGCNEFPDWRDESDMEKYNHALRKFQEYEKAMKLIEGMN